MDPFERPPSNEKLFLIPNTETWESPQFGENKNHSPSEMSFLEKLSEMGGILGAALGAVCPKIIIFNIQTKNECNRNVMHRKINGFPELNVM